MKMHLLNELSFENFINILIKYIKFYLLPFFLKWRFRLLTLHFIIFKGKIKTYSKLKIKYFTDKFVQYYRNRIKYYYYIQSITHIYQIN